MRLCKHDLNKADLSMTAQLDFSREVLAERYQVQQQLGRKTGRRTLLAHDLETGELVVIKLLLLGQTSTGTI